jgi:rhamnose transport system permease protein
MKVSAVTEVPGKTRTRAPFASSALRESILLIIVVVVCVYFAVSTEGFTLANVLDRTRYWSAVGFLAIPMTFIIATAGIDLSVASLLALCGVVFGIVYRDLHVPVFVAAVCAVCIGGVCGAVNGFFISRVNIPPLVVTLATMTLFRGMAMGLSQARPVGGFPSGFSRLGQGNLLTVPIQGEMIALPIATASMLGAGVLGWIVLRKTWVGRYVECLGENSTAARFAAIPAARLLFALYLCTGIACGLAALYHTALFDTAKADAARGMELEAIACVVLGGTRISGGKASIAGTLLGLMLLQVTRYGLELQGVKTQYIVIGMGCLLIIAALLNEWLSPKEGRRS